MKYALLHNLNAFYIACRQRPGSSNSTLGQSWRCGARTLFWLKRDNAQPLSLNNSMQCSWFPPLVFSKFNLLPLASYAFFFSSKPCPASTPGMWSNPWLLPTMTPAKHFVGYRFSWLKWQCSPKALLELVFPWVYGAFFCVAGAKSVARDRARKNCAFVTWLQSTWQRPVQKCCHFHWAGAMVRGLNLTLRRHNMTHGDSRDVSSANR